MLDVLLWLGVFLVGGFLTVTAGAIFIAAIFWMQNGGENE
jgi:hypothetical protein